MSATDVVNESNNTAQVPTPTCMESVNRIVKLPVVESTIQTAQNIYEKVKDYNSVTNWTLQTAENTAYKAVDIAKPYACPVIKNFEGPIKKVDDVLCSGLDYVENKVPAVKLPPKEIYNSTKEFVTPAVDTAIHFVEPAMKTAKDILEPAVNKTRSLVEPVVEPIVENVKQKVDGFLHKNQEAPEGQEQNEQTGSQTKESSPENEIQCQDCSQHQ